jgi:hypothetical protein
MVRESLLHQRKAGKAFEQATKREAAVREEIHISDWNN